ncbi:hypothetical protein SASPL_152401 [Salvia splendens]|uniref:Uncharacterized protein n=1 Tax=Salvia splendens TaxID=180675 RepID=A0A8X8W333_SALSN|nr:uncharacterized protein LOC121784194 [Salvia splendens]KAG6387215.1 hypothetical protein SASPL_152401 [Salvia splendens]
MEAVKRRAVKTLVGKLTSASEQTRTEAICELHLLSPPETRPLIADADVVPLIAESLYSPSPILHENAAAALLNLFIPSKDHLILSRDVLGALSHALRHPASPSMAQLSAMAIFSMLSVESFCPIIGHKRDIIFGLVEIVRGCCSGWRCTRCSGRRWW